MLDFVIQHRGEAIESLAQSHGHGVLQLGTSHLQHVLELLAFLAESGDESAEVLQETEMAEVHTDMYGGGISVVGGLRAVHMVIGGAELVFASLVAHDFEGAVGNHLVGIHIGCSSGTALNHIDRELVQMLAVHNLAASLRNGVELLIGQQSETMVSHCGTKLGYRQTFDK